METTNKEIASVKRVALESNMTVRFSRDTHLVTFKNPTKSSLKRVQRLINEWNWNGERPLVSFYNNGTFGVFCTFYTWKETDASNPSHS